MHSTEPPTGGLCCALAFVGTAGRWEAVTKVLPYCEEAYFFDNYNGFFEVAEYVNGELIVKGNRLPLWVEELRDFLAHI